MRGNAAPAVNETQTGFAISLRAGGPQIQQYNVAPFARFVQIAELEFAADDIFERTPECSRNRAGESRILAHKTHMHRFVDQCCALGAGLLASLGRAKSSAIAAASGKSRQSFNWLGCKIALSPCYLER